MRRSGREERIDRLLARTTNVLSVVFASVCFPVYSHGLKQVAGRLGFRWSEPEASGLRSIAWRRSWEPSRDEGLKRTILTYNAEDCDALGLIVGFIRSLKEGRDGAARAEAAGGRALDCSRVDERPPAFRRREWCKATFALPDFDLINRLSYFDYQREKVFVRTSPLLKRNRPRGPKRRARRPVAEQRFEIAAGCCRHCGGTRLEAYDDGRLARLVMDLKVTGRGIRRRWLQVASHRYRCLDCGRAFVPLDYFRVDRHSHSLKAWAMYEHVAHRASFSNLEESFRDCFKFSVGANEIHQFKFYMAEYYKETYRQLIGKIVSGRVVHVDETEVHLKGAGKGYVWVFTNLEEVVYLYRPSREGGFLREFLEGFRGVLVSDFFSAYDSLPCAQQKCLIHLMRDLNHDILGNPFDDELKALASDFGALLRRVVTTIDRHGLKKRHLGRHRDEADRFFSSVGGRCVQSEVARGYQGRFAKYRAKLFAFLDHDGVPWNNNNAEHAVKRFAHYRELADGLFSEAGLGNYLTLLSVHQTCAYKRVGFLEFLLSQERDVDRFCGRRSRGSGGVPYDLIPEGYIPTHRRGKDQWKPYVSVGDVGDSR